MLVLSRKKNERIVITVPPSSVSQTIELNVRDIRGDKARLAFEADRSVVIHRHEVFEAIARDKSV